MTEMQEAAFNTILPVKNDSLIISSPIQESRHAPNPDILPASEQVETFLSRPASTEKISKIENSEIASTSKVESPDSTHRNDQLSKNSPNNQNSIKESITRLKYLPSADRAIMFNKIKKVSVTGLAAAAVPFSLMFVEPITNIITTMPNIVNNIDTIFSGSAALFVSSAITLIGSTITEKLMKQASQKRKMPYSQLLTVNKICTPKKSVLGAAFKKNNPNYEPGYAGELHFVGKDKSSWHGLTNPLMTIRDGAQGLYNLATACEQNDSQLEGISMFGGVSWILNKQFERFGFQISDIDDFFKPQSKFKKILTALGKPTVLKFHNGKVFTDPEIYMGVISRQSLIEHKKNFERMAGITVPNSGS